MGLQDIIEEFNLPIEVFSVCGDYNVDCLKCKGKGYVRIKDERQSFDKYVDGIIKHLR